jgi:hypothetical protein
MHGIRPAPRPIQTASLTGKFADTMRGTLHNWHGFDFIWNQAVQHKIKNNLHSNPMTFNFNGYHHNDK